MGWGTKMMVSYLQLNIKMISLGTNCGTFDYRFRYSAWKNGCDTLTVMRLHENWTWSNSGIEELRN